MNKAEGVAMPDDANNATRNEFGKHQGEVTGRQRPLAIARVMEETPSSASAGLGHKVSGMGRHVSSARDRRVVLNRTDGTVKGLNRHSRVHAISGLTEGLMASLNTDTESVAAPAIAPAGQSTEPQQLETASETVNQVRSYNVPRNWAFRHDQFISYLFRHCRRDRYTMRPLDSTYYSIEAISRLLLIRFPELRLPGTEVWYVGARLQELEGQAPWLFNVPYGAYDNEPWGVGL